MEIIQRKTRYPVHLHLQKYRSYIHIFQVTCWFSGTQFQSCIVDPPWSSPVGSWPTYLVLWQHPLPCQGLVIELLLWWPPGASLLPPKHFSLDPRNRINIKKFIKKYLTLNKEKILSELISIRNLLNDYWNFEFTHWTSITLMLKNTKAFSYNHYSYDPYLT